MKKVLFAMIAAVAILVSCEKNNTEDIYTLEGQWISEVQEGYMDYPSEKEYPSNRMLMDVGVESGAGKLTMAILMEDENAVFSKGDIVLVSKNFYTYDSSTGNIVVGKESAKVTFLSKDMIKLTLDGVDLIFKRVAKIYSLADMKTFEDFLEDEFLLTPSREADWAGGEITFMANREIVNMTYDVLTEGVKLSELCATTLENNTLTLGLYVDDEGVIADCDILIKASDADGNETTCIVTSEAWRPVVYRFNEEQQTFVEYDLKEGWARGVSCCLGAVCAVGEIEYDYQTDSFAEISYTTPDFMSAYGSNDNKVVFDIPNTNGKGVIAYTYGGLIYELEIEIID